MLALSGAVLFVQCLTWCDTVYDMVLLRPASKLVCPSKNWKRKVPGEAIVTNLIWLTWLLLKGHQHLVNCWVSADVLSELYVIMWLASMTPCTDLLLDCLLADYYPDYLLHVLLLMLSIYRILVMLCDWYFQLTCMYLIRLFLIVICYWLCLTSCFPVDIWNCWWYSCNCDWSLSKFFQMKPCPLLSVWVSELFTKNYYNVLVRYTC